MGNFVSNSDAATLFEAVGKKKLTVTDTMPTAAEANVGVAYLYLGADTQDFEEGGVYKCQEITPATDPKTYEYIHIFTAKVDLSLYKRIFGGTVAAWDLLTDEQKAQYQYTFFDGDSNDYFAVVDAVTDGDMHPVSSNAVYDALKGRITLLWTNPNLNSQFAAQDIMLDLADYDFVMIRYTVYLAQPYIEPPMILEKGEGGVMTGITGSSGFLIGAPAPVARLVQFASAADRLTFGEGYLSVNGAAFSALNSACIPWKIYGINLN